MTRLGTAIALAYALAVITAFLSVVAIWPSSSSPSLSVVRPPVAIVTATPQASSTPSVSVAPTVVIPTERPPKPPRPTKVPIPTKAPTKPPTPPPIEPPILAIHGEATFYCLALVSPCTDGFPAVGLYAAAGAELRTALGDWRGRKVTVWHGAKHVTVMLIDSCSACDIDVYASAFVLLAPLELGVLDVEIRW